MYNAQTIRERLKEQQKVQGIKNSDIMMEDLGLNVNIIRQMSDNKGVGCFALAKIADYLNCSVDYLLGRTDTPDITNEVYNNRNNGIQNVKNGTVNINQSDEMTKEISMLLSGLTYRQKTDLMKQIYNFIDETKKANKS